MRMLVIFKSISITTKNTRGYHSRWAIQEGEKYARGISEPVIRRRGRHYCRHYHRQTTASSNIRI